MGASRVVDGKLDLTQNTVAITYLSNTSRNALLVPVVMVVYTVHLTRNFMKSNNSVEILCGFRKACAANRGIAVLLQQCLPFLQKDTSLSADLSVPS